MSVLFSSAVGEGGIGVGGQHVLVGVISGDAGYHFVNERLSLAVSMTSCL